MFFLNFFFHVAGFSKKKRWKRLTKCFNLNGYFTRSKFSKSGDKSLEQMKNMKYYNGIPIYKYS